MAKGFQQEYGVNYDETFASIANMTSIHYFIVVIASMQGHSQLRPRGGPLKMFKKKKKHLHFLQNGDLNPI